MLLTSYFKKVPEGLSLQAKLPFRSMQHKGEMKAREKEGRCAVTWWESVFLDVCSLDVSTAAVKELMHGPCTSLLCEMTPDPAMVTILGRKSSPYHSEEQAF